MPGRPRDARDPMIIEGIMVLLFESLRRVGGNRDNRLRHLPVVDGAIVSRDPWLRGKRMAGFRHLSLEPTREGNTKTGEKKDVTLEGKKHVFPA